MSRFPTREELCVLNEACRRSLKAGEEQFQSLCATTGLGTPTKDGKPVLLLRPGALGGVGTESPVVEALACLVAMGQEEASPMSSEWAAADARRLGEILLDYPVLLHPRIVWDMRPRTALGELLAEPVPMLPTLLTIPFSVLPTSSVQLRASQAVRRFCEHAAVIGALRAKTPYLTELMLPPDRLVLPSRGMQKAESYGWDTGSLMQRATGPRFGLVAGLLALDRIRFEMGFKRCELALSDNARYGIRSLMRECFSAGWIEENAGKLAGPALSEMELAAQRNPDLNLGSMLEELMWDVTMYSFRSINGDPADSPARLERAVDLLERVHAAPTRRAALDATLRALFPLPGEPHTGTPDQSRVDQNTALSVLSKFVEEFDVSVVRQRVHQTQRDTAWDAAMRVLETHHAMSVVIDAATGGSNDAREGTAPARRRAHL